jgi:DNA-binding transcriptional ArsR family regulator
MKALTEKQMIQLLERDFNFPPLKAVKIRPEADISVNRPYDRWDRPDLAIDLVWQDKKHAFLAEVKRSSTPKSLDESLRQLKSYVDDAQNRFGSVKYFPLLVVPYLSQEGLARLMAANVSGIDLSGNGVVIVPGEWFIYRTGAPNRYPSSAPIKNVFRGTSSLVARVFLIRPEFGSVTETYEEIKRRGGDITLPTVSKALKALQEELLVSREEKIKLLDPGRLLEVLEQNYRRPIGRRRLKGKFPAGRMDGLSTMASNSDANNLRIVADDPTRYALMPGGQQVPNIYTPSIETALRDVEFTENSRFPDVEIIETDDQTIYFDRRQADGFYWTSPLESYLALRASGKRERETADQMREDIKEFRYYM